MAEFSELVRTKKRICAKYKKDNCCGCPIPGILCGIISISSYSDLEFKELEDALMAWAAEHPEPVYPTWVEWLHTTSAVDGTLDIPVGDGSIFRRPIKNDPIPADIAEKLGIEPKPQV